MNIQNSKFFDRANHIIDKIEGFELSECDEAISKYDDMLDECVPDNLSGLPSYAEHLKETDNIMYMTGFNEYIDGLDSNDFSEYTDLIDELDITFDQLREDVMGDYQ
jgi:hypothetical protein